VDRKAQLAQKSVLRMCVVALVFACSHPLQAGAQQREPGQRAAGAQSTARASAPKDFIGYWVSVVTEQWHLRMLMPPKGEYSMLPLNAQARAASEIWTPAQDAGNECRAYGAAVIMRVPGRLHIHWADDNTLQIDTDSGTQTRLLHFEVASAQKASETQSQWQGYSIAAWAGTPLGRGERVPGPAGDLRVVTTRMKPGYLRKNGVPYSEKAALEEYFDTFTEPDNTSWLVVSSIITDPQYLTAPYTYSVQFKKIPDGQGWDPTPCRADEVR
jgi:hypothetical protein